MSTETFSSIWDAIEDTPAEAENMRLRSSLMVAIQSHIQSHKLTQISAAKLFGVTQPRMSDLKRGKIDLFSLDALVNMVGDAGLHVDMRISETAARPTPPSAETPRSPPGPSPTAPRP